MLVKLFHRNNVRQTKTVTLTFVVFQKYNNYSRYLVNKHMQLFEKGKATQTSFNSNVEKFFTTMVKQL